ncbi:MULTISPECIES: hypothetical protein [unclassified Mesorhizobium]|uniref:hypothetical protein n=1 Tax=Mesorhizobium sp. LNJC398B00 TaxID=1287276 RepID=UPI0003CEA928|nr:hypothetical protein [Mesorhizobium sp. LNJC398B00]ESY05357.1 hypothetical protein X752_26020 [Mesorhizobium sp. LNJC398B00]
MTTIGTLAEIASASQVDPRDITDRQLAALFVVRDYRLIRCKNGWRAGGSPRVTLDMMSTLAAMGLVNHRVYGGKTRPEITGVGRNTLTVAEQRRRKAA